MNIRLYINNQQADIAEQELILYTYTMDDVTSPAVVKNSYSQSISLKGTPANDKIFGYLGRADRHIAGGAFNPLQKYDFKLMRDTGEVLEEGYCKVTEVAFKGDDREYKVNLYGGLGSFLYALKYDDNGSDLTLADLTYTSGGISYNGPGIITPTAQMLKAAWSALRTGTAGLYKIFNWVPCDNGIPKDFGANKAIFDVSNIQGWNNLKLTAEEIAEGWGAHPDHEGCFLAELPADCKEWEVKDLRATLQRPALNMYAFLNACQVQGYTLTIDRNFLEANICKNSWILLPYPDLESDKGGPLQQTDTPCDVLLSIVKIFGLRFHVNGKNINILTNTAYFTQKVNDWQERIARDKTVTPILATNKYFNYKLEVKGEFAEAYKEYYGKEYGEQVVNTGFEYNKTTKAVFDDIKLKGAVDAVDVRAGYASLSYNGDYDLPCAIGGKILMYKSSGGEVTEESTHTIGYHYYDQKTAWNEDVANGLFTPLVQMRKATEPLECSLILVQFTGMHDVAGPYWHLSDTSALMLTMNDNTPCWDLRRTTERNIDKIPVFLRTFGGKSLELGVPLSVSAGADDFTDTNTIYEDWWQNFITDRYDKDTHMVTRKVNLSDINVNSELLRDFYFFEGAIWSLNAIRKHSITKPALTECEFVKVLSKDNYKLPNAQQRYVSVDRTNVPIERGQTQAVNINSNDTWTITRSAGHPQGISIAPVSGGQSGIITSTQVLISNNEAANGTEVITLTSGSGQVIMLTIVYHYTPVPVAAYSVDRDLCIGCGSCKNVCPVAAITMDSENVAVIEQSTCIGCGTCEITCPVGAINQE